MHSQERLLSSPSSVSDSRPFRVRHPAPPYRCCLCCDHTASNLLWQCCLILHLQRHPCLPPPLSQTGSDVLQVPSDLCPAHLSCQSQIFSSAPDRIWQVRNPCKCSLRNCRHGFCLEWGVTTNVLTEHGPQSTSWEIVVQRQYHTHHWSHKQKRES